MPLEPEELLKLAAEEMRQCNSPYLTVELGTIEGMAFLGILQLVVRHPDLPESMNQLARKIAEVIECQLSACGPAVRTICHWGWLTDPDGDH